MTSLTLPAPNAHASLLPILSSDLQLDWAGFTCRISQGVSEHLHGFFGCSRAASCMQEPANKIWAVCHMRFQDAVRQRMPSHNVARSCWHSWLWCSGVAILCFCLKPGLTPCLPLFYPAAPFSPMSGDLRSRLQPSIGDESVSWVAWGGRSRPCPNGLYPGLVTLYPCYALTSRIISTV